MKVVMSELSSSSKAATPAGGEQVLVSGASFAGLATAFWLNRLGYRVTVVEIADGLRKGGTPVDIEGAAIDALARMGMLEAVRARSLPPRRFEFKDADDSTLGTFGPEQAEDARDARYEIHRDDLLDILAGHVAEAVDVRFGQAVAALVQDADKVNVTFRDGTSQAYALVFGCDGARSRLRDTCFGAEAAGASFFMGGYFFIKVIAAANFLPAGTSQIFSVPGRTALLNGYQDRTDIALAFRSEHEIDYGHRDRPTQRKMIHDHFDGLGWKIPAMLDQMDADDDFYFDRINQIRMPAWSKGRVVLVGDAAHCVSPVAGMGGALAIIGAAQLADALARHGADHAAAFAEYQDELHPFVDEVQRKAVSSGMSTMFPSDEAELAERDRKLREGLVAL